MGRATANILASAGAHVVICGRNVAELKSVCEGIRKNRGLCDYAKVDVMSRSQIAAFFKKIQYAHKKIDALINNAGWTGMPKSIEKISEQEYKQYLGTNLNAIFYFAQKVIPFMLKRRSGMMITISSTAGKRANSLVPIYSATKFAARGLAQAIDKAVEGTGVRSIVIAPGGMNTRMRAKLFGKEEAEKQQSPEVVAHIIADVLRGTIEAFGGPLREFAVQRTNPYLLRQVGWQTREGRLTTKLQCRIDGDTLSARTDVRLSRLQLVRGASHDEAQARIGLPLGLITTLMKDRRGDITVSFPVGGRLSDPRFDFKEAIWSAVRTVAINALTLPVSWIGRVRFTPDSRIERIEVDPVTFEAGTATLTAQSEERVGRLIAFLDQLPDVTLALTPVVSSRDAEEMRRRTLEAGVDRAARQNRISRDEATARLFAQHSPASRCPTTPRRH